MIIGRTIGTTGLHKYLSPYKPLDISLITPALNINQTFISWTPAAEHFIITRMTLGRTVFIYLLAPAALGWVAVHVSETLGLLPLPLLLAHIIDNH